MKIRLLIASLALCGSASKAGQTATAADFEIAREAGQIAFVNTAKPGEHIYKKGDLILDTPLVWEFAAKLSDPIRIEAGGEGVDLAAGTVLPAVMLKKQGLVAPVQAYCTPRNPAERKVDKGVGGILFGGGSLWRGLVRNATDKQYCLIDADDDGIAEQSVMIHAGTAAMRAPVAITPVRLDRQRNMPIAGDNHLTISVNSVPRNGKSITFWLDVVQQGSSRTFTSFGSTQRTTVIPLKNNPLPYKVEMVGTHFTVLAVDGAEAAVTIDWPEGADRDAYAVIPDGLRVVIRYGYY